MWQFWHVFEAAVVQKHLSVKYDPHAFYIAYRQHHCYVPKPRIKELSIHNKIFDVECNWSYYKKKVRPVFFAMARVAAAWQPQIIRPQDRKEVHLPLACECT